MVFTTDEFFEIAIENWYDWPRPLNAAQMLRCSDELYTTVALIYLRILSVVKNMYY